MSQGETDDERETLSVLNAILRHHVRNHLTVIRGRAQWLGRSDATTADIETICRHCDEMAATVDRIEAITNSLDQTGVDRHLDIEGFLDTELSTLRTMYNATITVDIETPHPIARADDLLAFVLREMCTNVLAVADASEPSLTVTVGATAETIEITVSSVSAEGVPESLVTEPFATTARAGAEDDFGLFLSDAILSRYDGSIEFDESDAGTFRIRASIPRADPD